MKNNSFISINQTLHGYLNGHSLLASSHPLNPVDERRMLILSDMSGAAMTRGFETYITGYRLSKEPVYVLAKTWYAPEMERPGCVWTHSLLIDISELRLIVKPQELLHLFRRPDSHRERDDYSKPLMTETAPLDREKFSSNFPKARELAEIISFLYENPSKQIFIVAEKPSQYENEVLKIWEYQGARMRQKFTFCTGAISDRSSAEIPFDLQIIPQKNSNRIEKENKNQLIIQPDKTQQNKYPDWVENLVWKYMFEESSSELKICLNSWDSDIQNSRAAYSKLLKVYFYYRQVVKNLEDCPRFVKLIADEFPDKNDAIALKTSFLNTRSSKDIGRNRQNDAFLLCLFSTKDFGPFDSIRPKLKEKAAQYLNESSLENLEGILAEILAGYHNPLGDAFIESIAEQIDSNKFSAIAQNNESLLRVLIYNNPSLGTIPIVWDANEIYQKERLDVLASSPKSTSLITRDIIWYILNAKKFALAYKVFDLFDTLAVNATLDWINRHASLGKIEIAKEWKDQLSVRPKAVMEWLISLEKDTSPNIGTLAWVAQFLDPTSYIVKEHAVQLWLKNTELNQLMLSERETIEYAVFLLTLALSSKDASAGEVIGETFLTVYNAVRDSKLSYESWQRISEALPEIHWYQSWDKCERLRRGLINKYVSQEIKTQDFLKATNQADVFEKILEYSIEHKSIRSTIKSEILASTKNVLISDIQQKILKRYF